jgi:NitT/TauT family transport system substrate-binding protein
MSYTRRRFFESASALGAASLLGLPRPAAAEPPPETKTIRIIKYPVTCIAPLYVSETLLRAEGFTQIDYVEQGYAPSDAAVGPGKADFDLNGVAPVLTYLDARQPVVALAGVHLGCYELFGSKRVRSVRELKGKRVAVDYLGLMC